MIHLYHCPTAPLGQTWIASSPAIKGNTLIVIRAGTAEIARAKAQLQLEYQALDLSDRKAFDLKGKLAALGDYVEEEDDLL